MTLSTPHTAHRANAPPSRQGPAQTPEGTSRRLLKLGDSNDVFIAVEAGLAEGDDVVLNPTALIEEARKDAKSTLEETLIEADEE